MDPLYRLIDRTLTYPSPLGVFIIALIYVALVIAVRWEMIALPARADIKARLHMLAAETRLLCSDDKHKDIVVAVHELIEHATAENDKRGVLEILFWSRGRETAIWSLIDEAETFLTHAKTPAELRARLAAFLPPLTLRAEKDQDAAAKDLMVRIQKKLAPTGVTAKASSVDEAAERDELRELHREALGLVEKSFLYKRDIEFDHFNNKVLWHVVVSLLAVVAVADVAPVVCTGLIHLPLQSHSDYDVARQAFLLLLVGGAAGGIMSRANVALNPGTSQTLRSVSWMTMFLSPPFGALAGWGAGVLVLALKQQGILLTNIKDESLWLCLTAIAIVAGFSERLFVNLAGKVENSVTSAEKSPAPVGTPATRTG